jgi:hypothetical protein
LQEKEFHYGTVMAQEKTAERQQKNNRNERKNKDERACEEGERDERSEKEINKLFGRRRRGSATRRWDHSLDRRRSG